MQSVPWNQLRARGRDSSAQKNSRVEQTYVPRKVLIQAEEVYTIFLRSKENNASNEPSSLYRSSKARGEHAVAVHLLVPAVAISRSLVNATQPSQCQRLLARSLLGWSSSGHAYMVSQQLLHTMTYIPRLAYLSWSRLPRSAGHGLSAHFPV
ncbi:hypothetical protein P171DRAFT_27279 [Karstenula rhodostoma CBS 690.94]|uniref:Uncharacterized protein n=1 Tax=Karstenula rhodostoma CBS 690.94 TaxID=1392251 RepID=A0A9P4PHD5_9PLEO|nr:hypothetical protein P171DRAFT_27279 [Karstenula rhodostoma CBS 690.94]